MTATGQTPRERMLQAMRERHSVRRFLDRPLEAETVRALRAEAEACSRESGLHLQLMVDESEAFAAGRPGYGAFRGCRNYLALVGPGGRDEDFGYYGERFVLAAQALGVNSCWVALTYRRGKARGQAALEIPAREKLHMVIALGYGETQGMPHRGRTVEQVSDWKEGDPGWYRAGVEAALQAPTAVNQQKFRFRRRGAQVTAKAGFGPCTRTDLGIAKYHFELGANRGREVWAEEAGA